MAKKRRTTAKQKYEMAALEHKNNKKAIKEEWTHRGNKSHLRATTFQTTLPKVHSGTSDLIHEVVGEQRDPKVGINHMNAAVPFSKDVHASHHTMLLRNMLFCKKCVLLEQ